MKTMGIAALALLAASAGFGLWTALGGLPYNTAVFTLHKLASVACFVLCVLVYINTVRGSGMGTGDMILVVGFIVSAVALLITGGIMSVKQSAAWLRAVHIAATAGVSLSAGWKLIGYLIR